MEKYIEKVSQNAGVEKDMIGAILSALMNFLAGCGNKPSAQELLVADNFRSRSQINRALLVNGIRPQSPEGKRIRETMIAEAKNIKEEEAEEFLSMCSG